MPSFDVVSEVNLQEIDNAVNQTIKEISQRYDFKGSKTTIDWKPKEKEIILTSEDDYKLGATKDILQSKLIKRNVPLKNLKYGDTSPAGGTQLRQVITIQQGIEKDHAKKIQDAIKSAKLKVQAQLMDDQIRVSSKSVDELQATIRTLRAATLEIDVQFTNMRE
jgi:cyclic-di-GMP-binding protein